MSLRKCSTIREVAKANENSYCDLYVRLNNKEGEKHRQREREVIVIKDRDGNVLMSEVNVVRRWKCTLRSA